MKRSWLRSRLALVIALAVVALGGGIYATLSAASGQRQPDAAGYKNLDERLYEGGQAISGFGGFYLDASDNSLAYVYMLDPTQQAEAMQALKTVLGEDRFVREIREVRVIQGQYTMDQLRSWYAPVQRMTVEGIIWMDLHEGKNRLYVGVKDSDVQAAVEEELRKGGVPREVVIIEIMKPLIPLSHTLQNQIRPTEAGTQVIGDFAGTGECTLGFNTKRDGVMGFVTPSHCSSTEANLWRVDGTVFYQPSIQSGNRIGAESIDPSGFTGGSCPPGKLCRWSDSIYGPQDAGVSANLGRIARPTGTGSIFIHHTTPTFRIMAEAGVPVLGESLAFVGRTSGWKNGAVGATCGNADIDGTNKRYLCQDLVEVGAQGGDSGSPVFKITDSPSAGDVAIKGMVLSASPTVYIFSSQGNIYLDLGASSTWDTCDPNASPPC